MADNATLQVLWNRCRHLLLSSLQGSLDHAANNGMQHEVLQGKQPMGFNGRFRVYKYSPDDFFQFHMDGSWPGARMLNGTLVEDAFLSENVQSWYSFLMALSDDYVGGETVFRVQKRNHHPTDPYRFTTLGNDGDDPMTATTTTVPVRTPMGGVLAFPHGEHPWQCLHASTPIQQGTKYIIRVDVLFGNKEEEDGGGPNEEQKVA